MRGSARSLRLCTNTQVHIERLQDRHLAPQDLAPGLRGREPRRAVDFRELLHPPGLRRPLQLERVALELGRIDIACKHPDVDGFGARLTETAALIAAGGSSGVG